MLAVTLCLPAAMIALPTRSDEDLGLAVRRPDDAVRERHERVRVVFQLQHRAWQQALQLILAHVAQLLHRLRLRRLAGHRGRLDSAVDGHTVVVERCLQRHPDSRKVEAEEPRSRVERRRKPTQSRLEGGGETVRVSSTAHAASQTRLGSSRLARRPLGLLRALLGRVALSPPVVRC